MTREIKKKAKEEKPKLYCPQCGSEVDPSDEFCLECGKILGSFDPHNKKTKKRNDLLILESLRK